MRLFTLEDIRDIYLKILQRGYGFIFSKISLSKKNRTKSSFNETDIGSSNWWIIPAVRERWNYLITGDTHTTYEEYISEKYTNRGPLKMFSIGSGISSHELKLARLNPAWDITCIDFAEKPLRHAEQTAREEGLSNIHFIVEDIYKYKLEADSCDLVFFHSSLHHFKNLENFMEKIFRAMKTPGQLIINEYVGPNRMQYSREQLKEINHCLSLIDRKYRKIHRTNLYKNRFYGSGWIRMIVSDPSECVESEKILPTIYRYFKTGEEKAYGGNLIMPVLKDISQNFVHLDGAKTQSLETIFACEDRYLKHHPSDFIFGIYEKNG